jgi:hypothetical protein
MPYWVQNIFGTRCFGYKGFSVHAFLVLSTSGTNSFGTTDFGTKIFLYSISEEDSLLQKNFCTSHFGTQILGTIHF